MPRLKLLRATPALRSAAFLLSVGLGLLTPQWVQAERVRIGGAGSAMGSMRALAEAFQKTHTDFQYKLLPNAGSSGGIKAVVNGVLQIGLITRHPFAEEKANDLQVLEYGRTPLIFITNKPNVKGLKYSEITDIYAGRLNKWPDGQPVRLVLRPLKDADTLIFAKSSPEMNAALDAAHQRKGLTVAITADEAIEVVSRVPGSLCSSTLAVVSRVSNFHVGILAVDGVEPTLENLKNGRYPYYKPLYLTYDAAKSTALVNRFVEFVRSPQAQGLLAKWGSAPVVLASNGAGAAKAALAQVR